MPDATGRVVRCVVRTGPGERALPPAIEVSPERGVHGDAWSGTGRDGPENQVSMIDVRVLAPLADGDPERMALAGDNLHVELDLSEASLPAGTRIAVGDAVLEVSTRPHRPCGAFAARFGKEAAASVARATRAGLRARGVLCRVVRGGTIRAGDPIRALADAEAS